MILILEAVFRGRRIGWREAVGCLLAFAGVAAILARATSMRSWAFLSTRATF